MSQVPNDGERLLASLLSSEKEARPDDSGDTVDEDVDAIIDELEAIVAEGRRSLLGRKLAVDEDRLLSIVDRLRTAVPAEVRQAHRILDEHDRIIASAQARARAVMDEQGITAAIEAERQRILDTADREAEKIRADADRYVRHVLLDLEERLNKLRTSVRNGIEALEHGEDRAS